jgi:hypothetical protein
MNTFDDICRELSADLAAAVEAQTERTLRPRTAAKKPSGIEETRRRIKAAFEKARQAGSTTLVPPKDVAHAAARPRLSRAPAPPQPLQILAAALVHKAAASVSNKPVRMPHHEGAYVVVRPTASFEELVKAAIEAIERDVPKQQKKTERHEIKEAS